MRAIVLLALLFVLPGANAGEPGREKRVKTLEQLLRVLPKSQAWEDWLLRTGELPPDFDALVSEHGLRSPLAGIPNKKSLLPPKAVEDAEEWGERRKQIKELLHQWLLGNVPPRPGNIVARVTGERNESGATSREIELSFGPERKARLSLELLIPKGDGPFPVFVTQHNHRGWALIALRRGYLCCVYAGADSKDDTDSFLSAYPGFDWSRLTRRAWAASRCLDYLETLPIADVKRVAITGHSRNGKLSLIASALDERFAAVISSSSGAGGAMTARLCSEIQQGEGIEFLTRNFPDWFNPRLRFFCGREDRLPVDLHDLVALSAPRACLLSIALNDNVENSWAMQQTFLAVQPVYKLLNAEKNFRILWRPGGHETWTTVIERYIDWCDMALGRASYDFPQRMIHPWDWDGWLKQNGAPPDMEAFPARGLDDVLTLKDGASAKTVDALKKKRDEVAAIVQWMMGEAPPAAVNPGHDYGKEAAHIAAMLGRNTAPQGIIKEQLVFGDYIAADVYYPQTVKTFGHKVPSVLWLGPACSPNGYAAAYRIGEQTFHRMASEGYVVFCFDPVGTGRRIEEVENFYARYPRWSLLGKHVRDIRAALDAMTRLQFVDPAAIYGVGYGLGAFTGLHAGVVDPRFAGFASVCGPQPFRLDTAANESGGIARWAQQSMLAPRMGLFVGREAQVPYDVHNLIAAFAPRPLLVISPQLDREAKLSDVTKAVESARAVYALHGAKDKLEQASPEDYNRFGPEMQTLVLEWLRKITTK
ncbi:MAG TPA: hypothetical protein VEK08_21215 [Planctomycetota bacterium]|nr:hypothetical protein [Planctomycetota bacterium]